MNNLFGDKTESRHAQSVGKTINRYRAQCTHWWVITDTFEAGCWSVISKGCSNWKASVITLMFAFVLSLK